ncbi:hypothetical protein ACJRO7_032098 [Eucalyptus globulus]|uniref:Uncharacterized protein n=1 Tax=Eucalyptus globulus TaxID=34317 RepID=A0ABD3JLS9_EUCGL
MAVKFLDWYAKIAVFSALVGVSMELFMIKTSFYGVNFYLMNLALELTSDASAAAIALAEWEWILR